MGFFDAIKNAFHHPVDVNIVSDTSFKASDAIIPMRIEIINKEPDKQFDITQIIAILTKTPEQKPNESPVTALEGFKETQEVTIVVPASSSPQYFDFELHNTAAGFIAEAAEQVIPDNPLMKGLLSFADKAQQFGNIMDSKNDYTYNMHVELHDINGMQGYDDRRYVVLSPGEIGGTSSAWHT